MTKHRFNGTYEELQSLIASISPAGNWDDLGNQKQFRAHDGAVLNWWQSTGTVTFQGIPNAAKELEATFLAVQGPKPQTIRGLKEENARLKKLLDDTMAEIERLKANAARVASRSIARKRGPWLAEQE